MPLRLMNPCEMVLQESQESIAIVMIKCRMSERFPPDVGDAAGVRQ